MISTLTLINYPAANGTHALDWRGVTTLSGPSGAGKSTFLSALLAPLGIYPVPPGASVDAVTGGGTKLSIRSTKSSTTYTYEGKAGTYKGSTWRDFSAWSPIAQDPDLARAIAVPLHWHTLAATDLGRPLRDLLMRILPPVDVHARIIEHAQAAGYSVADLLTAKPRPGEDLAAALIADLLTKQTAANSARDQAKGRKDGADARLTELRAAPVPAPDEAAITAAKETTRSADAWSAYDASVATYQTEAAKVTAAKATHAAWKAARAALPAQCPEVDPGALTVARKAVDEAAAAVRAEEEAARNAAETARLEALRTDADAAAKAWRAAVADLGPEPTVPRDPPEPAAPGLTRPTEEEATAAATLILGAGAARALHAKYSSDLLAAEQVAEASEATHAQRTKDAARVTAALASARAVPTLIAAEQIAKLGDTGRVRFTFPTERTKQTPHVLAEYVHDDGTVIPFDRASTGEQEAAGAKVQACIRTAAATQLGKAWGVVPVVIERGHYGGTEPWPDIAGPVIVHHTTDAGPLTVSAGYPTPTEQE